MTIFSNSVIRNIKMFMLKILRIILRALLLMRRLFFVVINRNHENYALILLFIYSTFIFGIWASVFALEAQGAPLFDIISALSAAISGLCSALFWAISAERMKDRQVGNNFNIAAAGLSGITIAFSMVAITFPENLDPSEKWIKSATHGIGPILGLLFTMFLLVDEIDRVLKRKFNFNISGNTPV